MIYSLINRRILDTTNIKFFILDEADQYNKFIFRIAENNITQIRAIYSALPKTGTGISRLQVCFFSATLYSPEITKLADIICKNPIWVDLKGPDAIPDTVLII